MLGKRYFNGPVTRWLQKYRNDGISGLLEIKKAPGAKRKIDDAAMPTAVNYAAFEEELKTEKGFSSYGAIVEWLKEEHGQDIEYATVYAWVRYRLGAKLKVPRPQSHKLSGKMALAVPQETTQKSTFLFFTNFTRLHPINIRPTYT
ncbi:helix-turn-helix domain-containing protein [Nostoc sp.]|uniref:helix-turn-helix domain-containing protein n=1 Tax=Nostoc sp. TaxID=1180 RepID=UPI002FFAAEB0